MRFSELLSLGDLLEVEYGDISLRTKLVEIVSDTEILVLQPTMKGVPVQADVQNAVFTFYRSNGCFHFTARIGQPFRKGGIMVCRVARVSDVEKIQRRLCYRLPVILDAFLYELDGVGQPVKKRYRAQTIDLSEKSVLVASYTGFEEETPLEAEIMLSDKEAFRTRAKVLHCIEPDKETDPFEIVLIFTDQQEKDRSYLRRYIFNRQVQQRKKGFR